MVRDAIEALIDRLGVGEPSLAGSPEAAIALALADRVDAVGNKAAGASQAASQLLETLAVLRALAPADVKETPLDEIRARRDRKVAGQPDSADSGAPKRRRKSS